MARSVVSDSCSATCCSCLLLLLTNTLSPSLVYTSLGLSSSFSLHPCVRPSYPWGARSSVIWRCCHWLVAAPPELDPQHKFQQVTFRCKLYTQGPQHHRGREPSLQNLGTLVSFTQKGGKHFLLQYTLWQCCCCFVNKNILLSRSPSKTKSAQWKIFQNSTATPTITRNWYLHSIVTLSILLLSWELKETRTHNG
jgi:hypothetical protein